MQPDPAFDGPGRFLKGNLHTHSTLSDGAKTPAEVCALYAEGGYDFLALTDHFWEKYGFPIADTRPFRRPGFTTLLGAELHAPATRLGDPWHILSVGLPLDFAPTPATETGPELAARAAAAGAFVAIAHPEWYGLTIEDAESLAAAHAVEVHNHTSHVRTARGGGAYLADALLARGRRVNLIAVDDAHFRSRDWFGGWVMVRAAEATPEAILAALKAGYFYASQGPRIEAVLWGEDSVEVHCSPAASVIAAGHAWRATQALGEGLTRVTLPLGVLRGGNHARIVVTDAEGRRAWSNPRFF
ncbi:MAG: hypothetical protein K2X11_09145 [Acetobacteraceae bacterium]|nr:hypothetical protein [Acetobacteraceae bacterium]